MKRESVYSVEGLEKYRAHLTPDQFETASRSVRQEGGVILEFVEGGDTKAVPVYWRSYGH